jgi:hypothetical protein
VFPVEDRLENILFPAHKAPAPVSSSVRPAPVKDDLSVIDAARANGIPAQGVQPPAPSNDMMSDLDEPFKNGAPWNGPEIKGDFGDAISIIIRKIGVNFIFPLWFSLRMFDFMFVGSHRKKTI